MALAGSTLGARIRDIRVRVLGFSQREMASKLRSRAGFAPDPVTVSRWERGAVEPSFHYLRQIAALAEVSVAELVGEETGAAA